MTSGKTTSVKCRSSRSGERRSRSRTRRINKVLLVGRDRTKSPRMRKEDTVKSGTSRPNGSIMEASGKPNNVHQTSPDTQSKQNILEYRCSMDVMTFILFVTGFGTRVYSIDHPNAVVFDEENISKSLVDYYRQTDFTITDPPLYPLILSVLVGARGGNLTGFQFLSIGSDYPDAVPYITLRLLLVISGSLISPLIYHILLELEVKNIPALVSACLITFDSVIIEESRMFVDGQLVLCLTLSALLYSIKITKTWTVGYKFYINSFMCGIFISLAFSMRYNSIFTSLLCIFIICERYWTSIADILHSNKVLVLKCIWLIGCLLMIPLIVYLLVWLIYLNRVEVLPQSNTSLSDVQIEPVYSNSTITVRSLDDKTCWLHSHNLNYPKRYEDGRGSSHQQQVTCYPYMDDNNRWTIHRVDSAYKANSGVTSPLKDGDLVKLIHEGTGKLLNSHNVAAPVSPKKKEVSCVIDYNISMPEYPVWKLEVVNEGDFDVLYTEISEVKLLHEHTKTALTVSGKQLDDWGIGQLEVVGDKFTFVSGALWTVDTISSTAQRDKSSQREKREKSFINDFITVHKRLFVNLHEETADHPFSCPPQYWIVGGCTLPLWANQQVSIQMLPNRILWISNIISLLLLLLLYTLYLASSSRQTKLPTFTHETGKRLQQYSIIAVGGFLLNYLPYLSTDRQMFIYNYIPTLIFTYITPAFINDLILRNNLCCKVIGSVYMTVLLLSSVYHYYIVFPVIYGHQVSLLNEQYMNVFWDKSSLSLS